MAASQGAKESVAAEVMGVSMDGRPWT